MVRSTMTKNTMITGGFMLAEYRQQDAEFTGYEIEVGTVIELPRGALQLTCLAMRSTPNLPTEKTCQELCRHGTCFPRSTHSTTSPGEIVGQGR
ncbi:MAG: hypothetical protein CM15mP84_10610 [Cellvibrionales bacterium]|nr:MAG: hypothetical protein CM15mP84_10610 [Cellvibrionales bacterium]